MTGSMSANTGRAPLEEARVGAGDERERRRDDLVARRRRPTRAQREVQAGRAARDRASRAARRCAPRSACSNAGTRGPSDSWPGAQHLEHELLLARAEDGLGERDHSTRVASRRGSLRAGCSAYSSESTSASQDAAMTFSLTPIEPHDVVAVGGVEQHARDGVGALGLVEDADLEVDELDVLQVRVDLADRVAQRAVERVDRAVALGRAHVALAVDPDLDRRLASRPCRRRASRRCAPGLEPEQRLVLARLLAHQQLERAVGGLEVVAARARAP